MAVLCLSYSLSYAAFVLPYGYMQTFLEYIGYDVVGHGIILPSTVVVAITMQSLIGYSCDKYKTDKKFFDLYLIVFVLFTLMMYRVTQRDFFLHLIPISLVSGTFRTTLVMQDAWTLETGEIYRNNFSPTCAFGAIGWMIGSLIGTLVIEYYDYPALGYVFAGPVAPNILLTMSMRDAARVEKSDGIHASDSEELLLNKKYVVVVLIFPFVNVIATADIYTTVDKMMALDAKEGMVGARRSIQVFTELPLPFAGTRLLREFSDYKLMAFNTSMYIIHFLGYAIVQGSEMVIVVTLVQCITHPPIMIISKTLADDITSIYPRSSGQTVVSAFYVGLFLPATPVMAGAMVSSLGVDLTLALAGPNGLVPLGPGILYKRLD